MSEHGLACGTHFTTSAWHADFFKLKPLAEAATAVVTGTVVEVGDGRWVSADGRPPVNDENWGPYVWNVYRVGVVELSGVGKHPQGDASFQIGSTIQVRTTGGTIDCLTLIWSDPFTQLVKGEEVALFLGEHGGLDVVPGDELDVTRVFPIVDGKVHGHDLTLTVDELLELSLRTR